jgi:hypothetical protein
MADDHPEQFHSELQSEPFDFHAICASKDAISFTHPDGHVEVFTPDATKGYFHFTVATAFPAGRVIYGWGLHPEVVASNYMTLLDQHLDLDHKMAVNDPKNRNAEDKIIGSIAAVNFPRPPNGASKWTILDRPQPAIQGVAVFWKNAQATQTALARHVMGRHKSTVSMDMMFGSDDSGFAVKLPSDGGGDCLFDGGESKEFLTAGYEYVSWANAPKELQYCFEDKPGTLPGTTTPRPNAIKSDYRGRQVSVIAGGLTGVNTLLRNGRCQVWSGADGETWQADSGGFRGVRDG